MNNDVIGKKYNRLTVIGKSSKSGYYLCKCDCGNQKEIAKSNLILGKTKSCGCYNKEVASSRAFDLRDKRFGKLLVIQRDDSKKNKVYWICKCDCGNILSIQSHNLTSGKKTDCGCVGLEKHNIIGKRFGLLTVIEKTNKTATNGDFYYLCQCDCGNQKEIARSNLVSKGKYGTISCGCHVSSGKHVECRIDKDREYHIVKNLYCKLKARHIKFGGDSSNIISMDLFWKLIKKECAYCGTKNSDKFKDTLPNSDYIFYHNGIDRVDSSKGYTEDNVMCCCKNCNIAKSDRTIEEYKKWYEQVYDYFIKKG